MGAGRAYSVGLLGAEREIPGRSGAPHFRLGGLWRRGLALLLFALALSTVAVPEEAQPELEFRPSTVSLPVGAAQQATALIVVHNPTDSTLRDLRLSWLPAAALDVQPSTPLALPALAPHADYVWTLIIKPIQGLTARGAVGPSAMVKSGGPEAGRFTAIAPPFGQPETPIDENLDLRLDYKTIASGRTLPQIILKSLPVKTPDLGQLDKVLDVQIKTTLESLDSSQWGSIYLVLKNNSTRTINIMNIAPIGKGVSFCQDRRTQLPYGSLPFCFYSSPHALILMPYQTAIEEFPVKANPRVKVGKYLLVFQIATQSFTGGAPLMRNIVISQPVDVDVLGESPTLTVAGIPAFFLLPGVLLLLTIGLCWSLEGRWWSAPDQDGFPLKCSEPNFWLVSVVISLLIAIIPWLYRNRWYFTRYRLQDIGLLWFAAILGGIVCYGIWWIYRNHRRLLAAERKRLLADAEAAQSRDRTRT